MRFLPCLHLGFLIYSCGLAMVKTAEKDNCEYTINETPKVNFEKAKSRCRGLNGSLAMMKTGSIQDFVEKHVPKSHAGKTIEYWIGAIKRNESWYWLDGTNIRQTDNHWGYSAAYHEEIKKTLILSSYKRTLQTMRWFPKSGSESIRYICEVPKIDRCESIKCQNGGTCVVVGCSNITNCECVRGYSGYYCERDIFIITANIQNVTLIRGQNISVTLNIHTYNYNVRIDVFKKSTSPPALFQYTDVKNARDIVLGPFSELTIGTKYWFRATPMAEPDSYYKYTAIDVVVQGPTKIKSIMPRVLSIPNAANMSVIRCTAIGVPIPTVRWIKNEQLVTDYESENIYQKYQSGNASLFVKNESRNILGNYTCHSYNVVNGTKVIANDTAFLRGKIDLISMTLKNDSLLGSVSIKCIYEGYPTPDVEWKWIRESNTSKIITNKLLSIQTSYNHTTGFSRTNSQLNVKLVEYLGPTKFACSARNFYENATQKIIDINKNFLVVNRNRIYHHIRSSSKKSYKAAQSYCEGIASNLAKITDNQTQNSLAAAATKLKFKGRVYVGAMKHIEDGSGIWRWHDGNFLYNETQHGRWKELSGVVLDGGYIAWKKNFPCYNASCLCMQTKTWQWVDCKCSNVIKFICEKNVAGTPLVFDTDVNKCSSNITIKWKPAPGAIGIPHRIDVTESYGNFTTVISEIFTPNNVNEIVEKHVTHLKYWTSYRISITVCPKMCPYPSITTKTVTTHVGIPGKITSANVTKLNKTCMIMWEMRNVPGITGFMINAVSTIVRDEYGIYTGTTFNENLTVSNSRGYHNFYYNFNRNYTFNILAKTCTGLGPPHKIIGSCITQAGPPNKVPRPIVASRPNDDDTMNITILFPDEMNGPITCIFVIVVFKPNQSINEKIKNAEDLKIAMMKTESGILRPHDPYIAIAISRYDMNKEVRDNGNISKRLGDGSSSTCNLIKTGVSARKKRETYSATSIEAMNSKLETDATYSYYTLSTTPGSDGVVHFETSNISYFKINLKNPMHDSKLYLIAVIVAIVVVLIIVLIVYMRLKNRRSGKQKIPYAVALADVKTQSTPEDCGEDNSELRTETDIPLTKLLHVYNSLRADGNAMFYKQFEILKEAAKKLEYSTEVASTASLKRKNRYKNILPSDHSRVKLQGDGGVSYINACYINGLSKAHKYIATQGPLPSTVVDFWRMIFEQNVQIIVMLAKCIENGKRKCERYWPDQSFTKQYGTITVFNAEELSYGCCIRRTFKIATDEENNTVIQLQFLNWPDHGVPVTTTNLTRFWAAVAKHNSNGPVVVHCSAGAGRTGAFIAYDFLLGESKAHNSVDVYGCVLALRKQRVDMVQTREQYMLVHKLILEDYLYGNTDMTPRELQAMNSDETIKKQFEKLSIVGPITSIKHGSNQTLENNTIVPYEHNRVIITRRHEELNTPSLNASTIETYGDILKLIAAQSPSKSSVEFFWRAIIDNNVNTIIMLSECSEKEQCYQYWPEEENTDIKVGYLTILLQRKDIDEFTIRRQMIVKSVNEEKTIIQYQCTEWESEICPRNASSVLEVIDKMNSSSQRDTNASVLVHCSDGAGRTGAFCAIVNLLERLKVENKIDVFRTVKDLRDCRPGMVQTLDQYQFCFKAVSEYLNLFSLYENFAGNDEDQLEDNPYMNV